MHVLVVQFRIVKAFSAYYMNISFNIILGKITVTSDFGVVAFRLCNNLFRRLACVFPADCLFGSEKSEEI